MSFALYVAVSPTRPYADPARKYDPRAEDEFYRTHAIRPFSRLRLIWRLLKGRRSLASAGEDAVNTLLTKEEKKPEMPRENPGVRPLSQASGEARSAIAGRPRYCAAGLPGRHYDRAANGSATHAEL